MMIGVLLYVSSIILYIYKLHWSTLRRTYGTGGSWDTARSTISALWDAHGWIWHGKHPKISGLNIYNSSIVLGYEVRGLENLPEHDSALIIYYHGAIPIDMYYLIAKMVLYKSRLIHTVADYFLFKIPGGYNVSRCNINM